MGVPDIVKLTQKRDVKGLIKAVQYGEEKLEEYRRTKRTDAKTYESFRKEVGPVVFGAMQTLSQIGDPRGIEPILDVIIHNHLSIFDGYHETLKNPYNFVSITVGRFGKAAVDPLLTRLKQMKGSMNWNWMIMALGWCGDECAIDPITEKFSLRVGWEGRAAAWALGAIGGQAAGRFLVDQLLGKFIERNERDAREIMDNAIRGFHVGKFDHNKEIGDTLVTALNESQNDLNDQTKRQRRHRIARALCEIGDERGLSEMINLGPDRIDFLTITKITSPRVAEFLVSVVEKYPDQGLRRKNSKWKDKPFDSKEKEDAYFAALALARLRDAHAVRVLMDVFDNNYMGYWRDGMVIPDLEETYSYLGIKPNYWTVARKALVGMGDAAFEALSHYLSDENYEIRFQASGIYNEIMAKITADINKLAADMNKIAKSI